MPFFRIPTPLRAYTGGKNEVQVDGATVGEAVDDLMVRFPALKAQLLRDEGQLRAFVNLFKGQDNVNDLHGLQTPLAESDQLLIIPSIAGGVSDVT